jgi:hypothetical protein
LKNAAKELYGLVNYGEIRRKIGFCTEKIMCMKLNELVYKGTIQIRIKGKTLRIKTPLCRALRKLNRLQGMYIISCVVNERHYFSKVILSVIIPSNQQQNYSIQLCNSFLVLSRTLSVWNLNSIVYVCYIHVGT